MEENKEVLTPRKTIKQGDIYLIYFKTVKGSIQRGFRPGVIIQNNALNTTSTVFISIPLTSKDRKTKFHYEIKATSDNGLVKDSLAICESVTTVEKSFIKEYIGHMSDTDLHGILNTLNKVFTQGEI